MSIITKAAFTGEYLISQTQYFDAEYDSIIAFWEKYYLTRLFGQELYELYLVDTASAPIEARFTNVENPFELQDGDGKFYTSTGFAGMLKCFIYAELLKKLDVKMTQAGPRKRQAEVSAELPMPRVLGIIESEYNKGVSTFNAIRWYMRESENAENYPEYSGEKMKRSYLGGGMFG